MTKKKETATEKAVIDETFHDELTAAFDQPEASTEAVGAAASGGLLKAVFKGLSDGGVKVTSLGMWLQIAQLVVELVVEYGPKVAEIVAKIRERLKI